VVGCAAARACWIRFRGDALAGCAPCGVVVAVAVARRRAGRSPRKIICARQIPRDLGLRKQPGRSFGERSGSLTRGQHGHRPARPVARSAEFPTGPMAINASSRCNQLRPAPQQLDAKRFVEILVQDVRRGWIGCPCPIPPPARVGAPTRAFEQRLEASNKGSKLRTRKRPEPPSPETAAPARNHLSAPQRHVVGLCPRFCSASGPDRPVRSINHPNGCVKKPRRTTSAYLQLNLAGV